MDHASSYFENQINILCRDHVKFESCPTTSEHLNSDQCDPESFVVMTPRGDTSVTTGTRAKKWLTGEGLVLNRELW